MTQRERLDRILLIVEENKTRMPRVLVAEIKNLITGFSGVQTGKYGKKEVWKNGVKVGEQG